MKCNICEKEVDKGSFGTIAGFVCEDPACKAAAVAQRKAFFAREWKPVDIENAGQLNENMTLFAYTWLEQVKKSEPKAYAKILRNNPLMTIPEELQLDFTEKVLNALPPDYHSSFTNRGHARMFCGGEFRLIKTIPKAELVKALIKAQIIKGYSED